MKTSNDPQFNRYYELHCKHLKLKGLQPKTIDAYTRALRRIGDYFDFQVDNLSQNQLLDYPPVSGPDRVLHPRLFLNDFKLRKNCLGRNII